MQEQKQKYNWMSLIIDIVKVAIAFFAGANV